MEQRLIDANALLGKAIEERRFVLHTEDLIRRDVIIQTVYQDLADFIDSVPTVEAVPVVRCKDCKHYRHGKHFTDINFCQRLPYYAEKGGLNVSDEDFCSYGERRDSDG